MMRECTGERITAFVTSNEDLSVALYEASVEIVRQGSEYYYNILTNFTPDGVYEVMLFKHA